MGERTDSFGYWLRRRRKALDLTQEELGRRVACSRHAIRKIEADERRPSRPLAERLADQLGVAAKERDAFLHAARGHRGTGHSDLDSRPLSPAPTGPPEADPFVGRDREYGSLLGLVARLTEGTGHAVLVEGEPGIGKSRLLREVSRYARSQGLCTLGTRCYEIERAMAYEPVIDLIAQALELATDAALHRLAPVSLAEIAALAPGVAQRVDVPALSEDFPQARQARRFRAIHELFDTLGQGHQLVIVVDDIQWADDVSQQFLHYLARRAARRPLLVLLAYRDDELASDEHLAALVESLQREPHVRHMPLARLNLPDTEALVQGDSELAARLHRETDGHPFFLASLLHALQAGEIAPTESGALPLPEAVRASVRARLAHVPPEARPTLDLAAVLGRRFDFDTLLAVSSETEETLLHALETLVGRHLLQEGDSGWYDFSHDKVREVAYQEIGVARRTRLHRAVAEALECASEGEASERDAHLAEHYERGRVRDKAIRHMIRAAERSQRLFALRDALHWLDRAVALAEAHPEALPDGDAADLYKRRGNVRAQAGQVDGAVADIRYVIQAATNRGDRARARDALIQLGMTYRRADDYPRATECLTQALAECRAMNDEHQAADTLYHLGTVSWSDDRNDEATRFHEEAVAICERLGLTDLVAVQAWHGRGEAHFASLEPRAAIDCYERSIALARGIGDKSYESENLMMVAYAHLGTMGLGDYATAAAKFEAALAIAERADLQWHRGPILIGRDHVRACTGHYGEAYEGMTQTIQWLENVHQARYLLMAHNLLAELLIDLGQNQWAEEHLDRALALSSASGITFWRRRITADRAIARLRQGHHDPADELEQAAAHCRENREHYELTRCLEALAEHALARGDTGTCLHHADELLALAESSQLRELNAVARRWRGEALLAQEDTRAATGELTSASRTAHEIGRIRLIYDIERVRERLGEEGRAEHWFTEIRHSLADTDLRFDAPD
ncbi:MAG: ATP-binding protein [Halofilum sp. (in: g-proteobacteria)]